MAVDVVRAWKDPEYRKTLTPEELASLPENPAGASEVSDEDVGSVSGGVKPQTAVTMCAVATCGRPC
jgi:mersacidin/lichenicidin family type 2 lantibiotic